MCMCVFNYFNRKREEKKNTKAVARCKLQSSRERSSVQISCKRRGMNSAKKQSEYLGWCLEVDGEGGDVSGCNVARRDFT